MRSRALTRFCARFPLSQMDALLELRQRLRADPSLPPGTKLTFLPFFVKASALCLIDYCSWFD